MKTVRIVSIALLSSIALISCKKAEESPINLSTSNDLAIAETHVSEVSTESYLYVTASTGLSLRSYANLKSDKLAVMPYGTKVKVIKSEENPTMTVGGIKGGMDEIEFNRKNGFAFNGYLSKFFPPERNISARGYADELMEVYPAVGYSEEVSGTVSEPVNTEQLTLPTIQWHEAFYIAKELFEIPSDLLFPSHKGKNSQVVQDKKPKKDIWVSELKVSRKSDRLEKIEYIYTSKSYMRTVTIVQEGETMKISNSQKVK